MRYNDEGIKCPICGGLETTSGRCRSCSFNIAKYLRVNGELKQTMIGHWLARMAAMKTDASEGAQSEVDTNLNATTKDGSVDATQHDKSDREAVVSIRWRGGVPSFEDTHFEFPQYVRILYNIARIIAWITSIVVAVYGFVLITSGGFVFGGFILLLADVIGLVACLYGARLLYELTILFFEHLKVMRQIRDLLVTKLS